AGQAKDEPHGGGLPRPVRPEEPGYDAGFYRECQAVHRDRMAVPVSDALQLNHLARPYPSATARSKSGPRPPGGSPAKGGAIAAVPSRPAVSYMKGLFP